MTSLSDGDKPVPAEELPAEELPAKGLPAAELPAEGQIFVAEAVSPLEEAVRKELEKIRNPKGNWAQTLAILVVSLLLFIGLGMRNNPIAFTALLVGVLFLHEMGHYLGMRLFGYRNVRMFFIPLFGAAVSGQKTTAKTYQEAIVTLLGPLPGLCLAIVLLVAAFVPGPGREHHTQLLWAAIMFGLINGINLLPVFPLDGGRLLNQILFSRNRYLEGVFQLLAALALIACGATADAKLFCVLGVFLLIAVGPTFKTNTIAEGIGRQFGDPLPPMDGPIPPAAFQAIFAQVRLRMPALKTAKGVAGVVFRVWEKMHVRPPGAAATAGLLLAYLLAAMLAVPWVLPVFLHAVRG